MCQRREGSATGKTKRLGAAVCALAFAIPAAVMLWVCASLGMAPWGDKTILISDMSTQYVEFFCALKNGELFFSWSKALGTSYIGVFSYYVSSPLSLLTLFVPNEAMPIGLMFLMVLKIGLAGVSFAVFAQKRFPGHDGAALICAVCYALMSYNAVYSICVMWLDGVIWLPLILLAVERILAGRSAGPLIAALTVCFISTWYISYMVGIFCALYLCARLVFLWPRWAELKTILFRFFGAAACALGLTAWLWLPTFLSMFTGKFSGGNVDYDGLLACDPLKLLGQLQPGQYQSITYGAPPYVFCGTAALVLAVVYFFLQKISPREKLANGALLAVSAASLLLSPLDKVWHLFQRPNWFPARYSFVVSFCLLYLAVQALGALLDWLGKYGPWLERGGALALAVLTVLELGFNTKTILGGLEGQFGSDSYQVYRDYYTANAQLVETAKEDAGYEFFRMGAGSDRGFNSPLSFGYPGITHYSSLYNYGVNQLTKKLGFAQTWMWCAYYGSTPVTDALFGVKYVISEDDMPPGYEPIAQAGELTLWKDPDVLPLAFVAAGGVPELADHNCFVRQNALISGLTQANTSVFIPVETVTESEGAGDTVFTFTGTGKPIYADLSASGLTEVLVNEEHLLWLGSSEAASVHYLGTPADGEEWTVTVRHSGSWAGRLWELDQSALYAVMERLDNTEILSVEKNGQVRLTARSEAGGELVTTIPAEKGWTAYVDGKKADTGVWLETFLTVPLPAGEHGVELRYTAPGLVPGIALGALSLAGLALACWKKRKAG
ncbi:MAG: YfhO family protein [Clostridiales bacterium]|nr:YfhO family protein [Clostridiales bacterium]